MEIIIRRYEHYNSALGKYINSKKEYDYEMKSRGFVPYEKGCQMAESKEKESKWIPSKDLRDKINYIKNKCDDKGNIRHPAELVSLYKQSGISFNPKFVPKEKEGGFDAA